MFSRIPYYRSRVGVDIDEVLAPMFNTLSKYHQRNTTRPVKIPVSHRYLYSEAFGITEQKSKKLVRDFYETPEFKTMTPLPGAVNAIEQLSKDRDLYIITGRHDESIDATHDWLNDRFGDRFKDVIFCNHFSDAAVSKADICRKLSIDLMIDDSLLTCAECMGHGTNAINFIGNPVYPWCEESLISATCWDDIVERMRLNSESTSDA